MLPAIHSLVAGAARPRTLSPARISEDYPNSQPLAFDRHRRLHIRAIHDPSELDGLTTLFVVLACWVGPAGWFIQSCSFSIFFVDKEYCIDPPEVQSCQDSTSITDRLETKGVGEKLNNNNKRIGSDSIASLAPRFVM